MLPQNYGKDKALSSFRNGDVRGAVRRFRREFGTSLPNHVVLVHQKTSKLRYRNEFFVRCLHCLHCFSGYFQRKSHSSSGSVSAFTPKISFDKTLSSPYIAPVNCL